MKEKMNLDKPANSFARKLTAFFLFGIVLINVILVIYSTHWLRPSADDYCNAWVTSQFGVFGAVLDSWNTFSGYITSVMHAMIWVGWPLAHLPLSLASAIPFLVASFGLGVTLLIFSVGKNELGRARFFWIPIFTAFLWWVFLWAAEALYGSEKLPKMPSIRDPYLLAHGLTHWQTLNGIYVMQLLSVFVMATVFLRSQLTSPLFRILALVFFGVYCGMTGPALAVSLIAFLILYFIYEALFLKSQHIISKFEYAILIGFIFAGLLASQYLSPGYERRLSMLGARPDISIIKIIDVSFQYAIKFVYEGYISLGALLVIVLVAGIIFLLKPFKTNGEEDSHLEMSFIFFVFAFIQIFVNRASEFYAYQGYWHFVGALICIFLSLIYFAIGAGFWLSQKFTSSRYIPVAGFILFVACFIGSSSNLYMANSIHQRQGLWSGGSGAIEGIADIEVEWIKGCWENVNRLRPTQLLR